ncbi:MAG: ABC transporter permease subunit [Firmicutes bacterium]|nr:ABC transporter permease subunit [Bacillota bacterium]
MNALTMVALKEWADKIHNRWFQVQAVALEVFLLVLVLGGNRILGGSGFSNLAAAAGNVVSLEVYFIPMMALTMGYDSVCGEREQGTLGLILSYPVARWQLWVGKYLGTGAALLMTLLGTYLLTGAIMLMDPVIPPLEWGSLWPLVFSSLGLALAFLAIAMGLSTIVTQRAHAISGAVLVWMVSVFIWDLGLMGAVMTLENQGWPAAILNGWITAAMLLNPVDTFRAFNLAAMPQLSVLAGSVHGSVGAGAYLLALALWVGVPIIASLAAFHRTEI